MFEIFERHPDVTRALQLSIRAAVSAAVSVELGELLRLEHPIYALVAAVIVTDLSAAKTRSLGFRRLIGSVIGAMIGAASSLLFLPDGLTVGLSIIVAMLISFFFRVGEAARLAGYVCGIVVIGHSGDAWTYALYRLLETVLGVTVALVVSLIPKLIRLPGPETTK